tara:strand:+ start:523 stop:714 length:192 start_codon:yes stop_codon:yes gene_type:complete
MASLDEAFNFPLKEKNVPDIETVVFNLAGRGSYLPLSTDTNTYKEKPISDLKMYNSLKEQKQF